MSACVRIRTAPRAPIITMLRTVSTPLLPLRSCRTRIPENSLPMFSQLFAGANEGDHSMESLPSMEQVKICFDVTEPAARPTLERTAATRRLLEHPSHSERAAWSFRLWGYAARSSLATKLSGRGRFGPFLRSQPELSRWPRCPTEACQYLSRMAGTVPN